MLNKKNGTKVCGIIIAVICIIMILSFGIVSNQRAIPVAEAESSAASTESEMTQEQEDEYYRSMGYEPVRKLGDLFRKYTTEERNEIKGMVLLNDIDCATDTSWHDFVDNWQETGYDAPSLDFQFNGMGHRILNGEYLKYSLERDGITEKRTIFLFDVESVENLNLENIAVAENTKKYMRNVHVRSVNNKNIVNNYGLTYSAPKIISNCSVEGTLEYDADKEDGIVKRWTLIGGLVVDGDNANIENSYFYGGVICNAKNTKTLIGGLMSFTRDEGFKLSNCFSYYFADIINDDNVSMGLIIGRQSVGNWSDNIFTECLYEYDAVYAGKSVELNEIGDKIEYGQNEDVIEENCDIEEIMTVPAALLGDKETVSALDFDNVWNLGEKDKHPTLRTLSVTVEDNTLKEENYITEKYKYNYSERYYNEGDKFELSFDIADINIGLAYLEIDGKDLLGNLSENKLTIDMDKNMFIAFQMGYRPEVLIKKYYGGKDYYDAPDSARDCLKIEAENVAEKATVSSNSLYALGDKMKIKLTVADGYHIKSINLPKEAVKIGENEYEIAVGKVIPIRADRMFYKIEVDIEKDIPITAIIIGIVAGVAVLALVAVLIVISKKIKEKCVKNKV